MLSQEKTLAVLQGKPAIARKSPKGIEMSVYLEAGRYTVQVNHKVIASAEGDEATARRDARDRAERLSALTRKPVTVKVY